MSQSTQCLGSVVPLAMFHMCHLWYRTLHKFSWHWNQFLLSSSEQSQIFIPFNLRKALAKPSFDLGKFSTKSSPISFDLLQSFSQPPSTLHQLKKLSKPALCTVAIVESILIIWKVHFIFHSNIQLLSWLKRVWRNICSPSISLEP